MKTRHALFALVVLLAAHGSARGDFIATATLTGDGEAPNSPGIGAGIVAFDAATDSLEVALAFANLSSPTQAVGTLGAAHIHLGDPGVEGPPLFPFTSFPTGVTYGGFSTVLTSADFIPDPAAGIDTFAEAVNAIEGGHTYFNIHTVDYPGGEIRGQLTSVPEPAGLLLAALGLGGVLVFAGRRRRLAA